MITHYYLHLFDEDLGPILLKSCSCFHYSSRHCLNGLEYLECQPPKRGIGFEEPDNGILRREDPGAMKAIAREITAPWTGALFRKWMAPLLHPFTGRDRAADIRCDPSVLQEEFARVPVLGRSLQSRVFFEELLCENLDPGRPGRVQLVIGRRNRREPDPILAQVSSLSAFEVSSPARGKACTAASIHSNSCKFDAAKQISL